MANNLMVRPVVILDSKTDQFFCRWESQIHNGWIMTGDKRKAFQFDDDEHAREECMLLVRMDPTAVPVIVH